MTTYTDCKYYRRYRKPRLVDREVCDCEANIWGAGVECSWSKYVGAGEGCKFFAEGPYQVYFDHEYFDDYMEFRKQIKREWCKKGKVKDFFARLISIITFGKVKPGIVYVRLYKNVNEFKFEPGKNNLPCWERGDISALNTNTSRLCIYPGMLLSSFSNPWYIRGKPKIKPSYEVGVNQNGKLIMIDDRRGLGRECWNYITFNVIDEDGSEIDYTTWKGRRRYKKGI